jgi:hypothetical protein
MAELDDDIYIVNSNRYANYAKIIEPKFIQHNKAKLQILRVRHKELGVAVEGFLCVIIIRVVSF